MKGPDRLAFTAGFDEGRDSAGSPRPGYPAAFRALAGADLEDLTRAVAHELERRGVSFGAQPFVIDPVPRLIRAAEWDALAAGLAQRARALNRFLLDAYGERRIVRHGVVAAAMIDEAKGYEPELVGRLPGRGMPAAVIGFDVVRDPAGEFLSSRTICAPRRASRTRSRRGRRSRTRFLPDSPCRARSTRSPTSCSPA